MKAILYCRVSTDDQVNGYSLDLQEETLRAHCERNNIEVISVYREDFSGKNFDRPELNKLKKYIKERKGEVNQLLIAKWDRFGRNLMEALQMIHDLQELGVQPISIEQPLDMSIPESKLMLAVYLSVPEVDNLRRSRNTKGGMRKAAQDGRWGSIAPRGYSNKRDELNKPIIVPNKESELITYAFNEVAKGRSQVEVRDELKELGLHIPKQSFSKMLRNVLYKGLIRVPPGAGESEYYVKGLHKSIVSEDVFQQVQEVLDGKRKKTNHPKIHKDRDELPLRGLLKCGRCGGNLTGSPSKGNGGRYFYYHCRNGCKERFRSEEADTQIEKLLYNIQISKEVKSMYIKEFKNCMNLKSSKQTARKRQINEDIEKNKKRINNIEDRFADGDLSTSDYTELKRKFENTIRNLEEERKNISGVEKNTQVMIEHALSLLENVQDMYVLSDLKKKKKLIGSIFTEKLTFKEKQCRTPKTNKFINIIKLENSKLAQKKRGQLNDDVKLSLMVTPEGFKPPTLRAEI